MKDKLLFVLLLYCGIAGKAQNEYPVTAIPESFKKDAYAIVRYEQTHFVQKDINNATEEVTKVITILKESGKDMANLYIAQDQFRELKSFSGEIILASGKVLKKIGKGDLTTTAYSPHLASDDMLTYYHCSSPSYPFTVKYKYEIKWKNGIAWYPVYAPGGFYMAVEKSEHRIQFPATESIRCKSNFLAPEPEKYLQEKDSVYVWKCENFPPVTREPYAPDAYTLFPVVYIAPGNFCFDKICGNMSDWKKLGVFLTQLLDKRDVLPTTIIDKVKEMTAGITDEKEKIKRIYEYLQSTTRYVSIQLGIGGFQPISAFDVAKTGYGDCKALSNYMKSMLNVVDIPSDYAIIHTEKERMFKDFSSLNQANHVILLVPLKNDSIWLECTSRNSPFNFVHSGIAGHDVLLINGENSRLCKVKDIPETMNTEENYVFLQIKPDASIRSSVKSIYKNHIIVNWMDFVLNKSEKDKINFLEEELNIQKPQISNIQAQYVKTSHPEIHVSYNIDAERYANQTGNRLFVPANPLRNRLGKSFVSSARELDIHIRTPEYQMDSIVIDIPGGYVVESNPQPIALQTAFGSFSSSVEEKENRITIVQQINIPTGQYRTELYNEIKDFFKKIDTNLRGQIVLRKKEVS